MAKKKVDEAPDVVPMVPPDLELHLKYRPRRLEDFVGQDDAVTSLGAFVRENRIPHSLLMVGPAGCGKTSAGRVVMKLAGVRKEDLTELNAANFRGVDTIREIMGRMGMAPIAGKARGWILDECHKLTNDAQNALLKALEEPPRHVYFVLCTTEPTRLLPTIRSRVDKVEFKALSPEDLTQLVSDVVAKEGTAVEDDVVERIVEVAEGSARTALVALNRVLVLEGTEARLAAITGIKEGTDYAISICRALGVWPKPSWTDLRKLIAECDEEPEGVRRTVLSYYTKALTGDKKRGYQRAAFILDRFLGHWYDSGKAGLALACWEVMRWCEGNQED
jgi:DNA polymerase III gamma/tau subunit